MATRSRSRSRSPARNMRTIEFHGLTYHDINQIVRTMTTAERESIKEIIDNLKTYYDKYTPQDKTALFIAVQNTDPDAVRYLLELGADPNIRPANEYSPLHLAVLHDRIDIVKLLLDNGADQRESLEYKNKRYTPLYTSVENGFIDITRVLLNAPHIEETINTPIIKDDVCITPLIVAVLRGDHKVVGDLKGKGAQLLDEHKAYTQDIFQILFRNACYTKKMEWIDTLLNKFPYVQRELESDIEGIDVNYVSEYEYTPLFNAYIAKNNEEVIKILRARGAQLALGELKVLYDEHPESIEEYRKYIVPVETNVRRSILHLSNRENNLPAARVAMREGAAALGRPWREPFFETLQPLRSLPHRRARNGNTQLSRGRGAGGAAGGGADAWRKSRRRNQRRTRKNRKV